MLYNYQEIIVWLFLLPVALNIILPLAMLAVWLVKQMLMGAIKREKSGAEVDHEQFPVTA